MAITLVEFVGFEGGDLREVEYAGDSTVGTSPTPWNSDKEDYCVTVIGNAGSDQED